MNGRGGSANGLAWTNRAGRAGAANLCGAGALHPATMPDHAASLNPAPPGPARRGRGAAAPLADPAEVLRRRALLDSPACAALQALADAIRAEAARLLPPPVPAIPDFDPCDGGTAARVLLLLETPGPTMPATMFVSRDNAGGTAGNLRRFLDAAGLPRAETVIWNAVPWIIHAGGPNRAPRRAEVASGLRLLPVLLDRLPRLRAAVLAGRAAATAGPALGALRPGLPVLTMPHPSPTYVNTAPSIAPGIVAVLRDAAAAAGIAAELAAPQPFRPDDAAPRT